jgi:hypothetical protein
MSLRLLLFLGFGCAATSQTDHTTTALQGVPPPAAAALRREAGTATIEQVAREREGGADLYEGSWYVDGRHFEVKVTATGELVEREEELSADQVPQPVRLAAIAALPKGEKLVFVRLLSGNYEAETVVDGKEHDVVISASGQIVPENDDDDEDDDGDDED